MKSIHTHMYVRSYTRTYTHVLVPLARAALESKKFAVQTNELFGRGQTGGHERFALPATTFVQISVLQFIGTDGSH